MEVAAAALLRGAAGVKDGGAFVRGETGHVQFLERGRGHGGNFHPRREALRRHAARQAESVINGVVLELEAEEFESQFVERHGRRWLSERGSDELAQSRFVSGPSDVFVHAVLFPSGPAGFPPQPDLAHSEG